jgi:hypothetical protein
MKHLLQFFTKYKLDILLFLLALIIRLLLAFPLSHDWDGYVFRVSAENFLHGVTPYQTVAQNDPTIYPDSDVKMTEQWYGYPALPLMMFTTPIAFTSVMHIALSPIVENGLLKLPFIFGDMLCAILVYLILAKEKKVYAKRAMYLILFNPLLIWISSAWGMFDIWIINFLLLFMLCIRGKYYQLAGVFVALSLQIKLFPVFFLPALVAYIWPLVRNMKDRVLMLVAFVETSLILIVPFFLSSPQGYVSQNLLMHLTRPAQGISIVPFFGYVGRILEVNLDWIASIGSVLMLGLVGFFSVVSMFYIKGKEKRLLEILLLVYLSTLMFNKVVNEQYFVVLLVMLLLLAFLSSTRSLFTRIQLLRMEVLTTLSVLFASVILGFHFLTFLPPFITNTILKTSTNYMVYYLSSFFPYLARYSYPNSFWTYYNAPVTITYIILLPMVIFALWFLAKGVRKFFPMVIKHLSQFTLTQVKIAGKYLGGGAIMGLILIFGGFLLRQPLGSFIATSKALTLVDLVGKNEKPVFPNDPRVGTFYNVWWNNPTHLTDVADDAWSKTTLTPLDGYYTSKNSYFVQHIKQMKSAGIDFAVVSYHLYDRERYLTFGKYADLLGFNYAPLIESGDALQDAKDHAVSPTGSNTPAFTMNKNSEKDLANVIVSSLNSNRASQGRLMIDGKPVVFIYDGHFFFPSWDSVSKNMLAEIIIAQYLKKYSDPFAAISDTWGTPIKNKADVIAQYPEDVQTFNNANKKTQRASNDDYKKAFFVAYQTFWKNVRQDVTAKVGPVYLMSTYQAPLPSYANTLFTPEDTMSFGVFDNEFFYSLSNTWSFWRDTKPSENILSVWETQETDQAEREQEQDKPTFLTVNGMYNDTIIRGDLGFSIPQKVGGVSVYDYTWQVALKNNPDYVLIASWNEFFEGSAIEPTKEYQDTYLKETKVWATQLKQTPLASN